MQATISAVAQDGNVLVMAFDRRLLTSAAAALVFEQECGQKFEHFTVIFFIEDTMWKHWDEMPRGRVFNDVG